jgi:3-deoxy-7-phosphoheptulonate synthase
MTAPFLQGGAAAVTWAGLPAAHQPQWQHHPAYPRTLDTLASAAPLVSAAEVAQLRRSLAAVAAGQARMLQIGDCAESFYECTRWHTSAKLALLDRLADGLAGRTGQPVVRVGRIGGQYAKPRSNPTEMLGGIEIPVFRGHLINSEVPTRAARQHDPRRMLWAYEASAKVLPWVASHRAGSTGRVGTGRAGTGRTGTESVDSGPWASHETLVIDYEGSLVRTDPASGSRFLGSTHLPWIGERTRQPDAAHVQLLAGLDNPVGCKIGPGVEVAEVLRLCQLLDPDRIPGRLLLIIRMGRDAVERALPGIVAAVRGAGHPVVWLCDPMHGNTVTSAAGLKTRHLADILAEARGFRGVLERQRQHAGGLHLEVAAADVTECVGGAVTDDETLHARYTTLCDPRLNPEQAFQLLEGWL